jgi:hypothetical protein
VITVQPYPAVVTAPAQRPRTSTWHAGVVRIVSRPESEIPHELRLQMVMLQDQAWPPDGPSDTAPWHDKSLNPLSVLLLDDDGGVVSALDILSKQIAHGGTRKLALDPLGAQLSDRSPFRLSPT